MNERAKGRGSPGRRVWTAAIVALLAMGTAGRADADTATAEAFIACIAPAIAERREGFAAFQAAMTDLFIAEDPGLRGPAEAAEKTQLALYDARIWLARHAMTENPAGALAAGTLRKALSPGPQDAASEAALAAAYPEYRRLVDARAAALAETQGSEGMERLRTVLRTRIAGTRPFDAAMSRLTETHAGAEDLYRACMPE